MIDVGLMDLIRQVLEISTADVNQTREALLDEQRSADARYAASSALVHPEGSTTPINEAYSRAQDRVADLRAKALKELPAAFKLLLALQVAEERRAEALRHRDMKWDQAFAKDTLGVDPAVADWFARLHQHGVHPHHLKQQAAEMVAIIADLITWKAKDAKFRDPDNPWRAVLQVYASRRIRKPLTRHSKAARSVPGTPTRDRHISDLGDYMFNEMVSAAWGTIDDTPSERPIEVPGPVMFDCSIYPEEPVTVPAVEQEGEVGTIDSDNAGDVAAVENEGKPDTLTPARAQAWAELVYDPLGWRMRIYWPPGYEQGNFDPATLIPALEEWIASGKAWPRVESFLAAVRNGDGAKFIEECRQNSIRFFARRLLDGDPEVLAEARNAGIVM